MGNATDPSLQSFTPFVSFLAYSFVLVGQTWHNNSSGGGGIVVVVLDNSTGSSNVVVVDIV